MLAKNNRCHAPRDILMSSKSGWSWIEYLNISEEDIGYVDECDVKIVRIVSIV